MMKLAAILSACVYTAVIDTHLDSAEANDGDLEGLISQLENEEIEVIRSQSGDYFKLEKGQHFYENKEKKERILIYQSGQFLKPGLFFKNLCTDIYFLRYLSQQMDDWWRRVRLGKRFLR